ncbi:hypothetical protein TA3x_002290 [Tundrisphaera sp. TA3]|uniref:hypothetical protein n=1 Tax=Tundrisphaera sp. TA3 TaxID=3435775 RepID=UPI003EBA3692
MAFSQSGIVDVRVMADGADLFVAWTAPGRDGATFQVYVDRRLAWSGTARRCHVPIPAGSIGRNVWVEVGIVGPEEPTRNHASLLSSPGGRGGRATLTWSGGTYLDASGGDNIQGFRIYQGSGPGTPVDEAAPADTVLAYPGGWINDGFGKGGFGEAGFGRAATLYRWQSKPLDPGDWSFLVVPFDKTGKSQGTRRPIVVTIASPPRPPARGADGSRLALNYPGPGGGQASLAWLPSPSEPR